MEMPCERLAELLRARRVALGRAADLTHEPIRVHCAALGDVADIFTHGSRGKYRLFLQCRNLFQPLNFMLFQCLNLIQHFHRGSAQLLDLTCQV